ncbi:hypothetical protein TNCV_2820861 [Trichonephila clavipes]|nr:hypothetical protein TNCV_2820861 [Trichonephila clavipes]
MKASIAAAPRERREKTINTRNPGQKFPSFFRGASPLRSECIGVVCQWSQRAVKTFNFSGRRASRLVPAVVSGLPVGWFVSPCWPVAEMSQIVDFERREKG